MLFLWIIPFLLQAPLILLDEWIYHRKRGLPTWERIGHPLDTLSVVICLSLPSFAAYSPFSFKIYLGLAVFSCFMVTKDEWVHKHHCPAGEHWLHAVLFLNHPVLLTAAGFLWASAVPWAASFLKLQMCLAALLMIYQGVYWNVFARAR
jgi:hypothetical protein